MSEREIFVTGLIFMSRQFRKVSRQSVEFLGGKFASSLQLYFFENILKMWKIAGLL